MNIDLNGKSILVTGASRGIGEGIARALAAAGGRVAVHYHLNAEKAKQLCNEIGNGAQHFGANLADSEQCIVLFEEVLRTFGKVDVLVNNAGIFLTSPLNSTSWEDDWDRTMDVNLKSAALLSRLAILHFLKGTGGQIINISSRAAFRGDHAEHLAYAASKAGMVALTKSVARAYGRNGITSFLVAPGWVNTDMSRDALDKDGMNAILGEMALNRLTEPSDLAPVIVLLASGMADHATGTTIDINAGSYVH